MLYEKKLIACISNGDERAFHELFDLYRDKLFSYIFHITKSKEVSEELVMEIFMKIWTSKELLNEVQNIDAFFYRMACNKAIDFLRAASRENKLRTLLIKKMEVIDDQTPASIVILKEYELQVKQLLHKLSPQQQLIFSLSREEGLTHQQIASHLHLSKNTVKNHLVSALKHLRMLITNKSTLWAIFISLMSGIKNIF